MALIGQAVSEEIFEIVDGRTDDGRTDDGSWPSYKLTSGELIDGIQNGCKNKNNGFSVIVHKFDYEKHQYFWLMYLFLTFASFVSNMTNRMCILFLTAFLNTNAYINEPEIPKPTKAFHS